MDDAKAAEPQLVQVAEVQPGTARFDSVLALAARVLAQDRHLTSVFPAAQESHVLGAFDGFRCVGFLRYLIPGDRRRGRQTRSHAQRHAAQRGLC